MKYQLCDIREIEFQVCDQKEVDQLRYLYISSTPLTLETRYGPYLLKMKELKYAYLCTRFKMIDPHPSVAINVDTRNPNQPM